MTMHDHHHIADAGDAEFDATMKMVGMDIVLVMIAGSPNFPAASV